MGSLREEREDIAGRATPTEIDGEAWCSSVWVKAIYFTWEASTLSVVIPCKKVRPSNR